MRQQRGWTRISSDGCASPPDRTAGTRDRCWNDHRLWERQDVRLRRAHLRTPIRMRDGIGVRRGIGRDSVADGIGHGDEDWRQGVPRESVQGIVQDGACVPIAIGVCPAAPEDDRKREIGT